VPGQTVLWVIALLLAVIATVQFLRWEESSPGARAWAQSGGVGGPPQAGARGIYAFTGQLTSSTFGVFMLDVDSGTLWCYELDKGPNRELLMKLVAARSWIHDRYLEDFNVGEPIPSAVERMVAEQQDNRRNAALPQGRVPVPGGRAPSPVAVPPALPEESRPEER
jgi:hypothetical protein